MALATPARKPRISLTAQVLLAITIGILLGAVLPDVAVQLQILGELFIRAIKMVIPPIVFLTIVLGVGGMGDLKRIGRVGGKALLYFEIVTTLALLIGLVVANVVRPGAGIAPPTVAAPVAAGESFDWGGFLKHLVPDNAIAAFATGDMLQVLFFAVLFGLALTRMPAAQGKPLLTTLERLNGVFFRILEIIMRAAPLGALGGMAYTIGKFGLGSLVPLAKLMASVYLTMAVFILVVLGLIARFYGIRLWRFLGYIKEEILIVLGTSSSEAALPRLMEKLERAGAERTVVGLVVPTGYSFNLDGTTIYLVMAALFIAQAYNVELNLVQQLTLMGILMITSKGAAGITGSGFVVLAGTLAALKTIPVEGVALLLGVDRFMSEARSITNFIGNGVATLVIAKSENALDMNRYHAALAGEELDLPLPAEAAVQNLEEPAYQHQPPPTA